MVHLNNSFIDKKNIKVLYFRTQKYGYYLDSLLSMYTDILKFVYRMLSKQ